MVDHKAVICKNKDHILDLMVLTANFEESPSRYIGDLIRDGVTVEQMSPEQLTRGFYWVIREEGTHIVKAPAKLRSVLRSVTRIRAVIFYKTF